MTVITVMTQLIIRYQCHPKCGNTPRYAETLMCRLHQQIILWTQKTGSRLVIISTGPQSVLSIVITAINHHLRARESRCEYGQDVRLPQDGDVVQTT